MSKRRRLANSIVNHWKKISLSKKILLFVFILLIAIVIYPGLLQVPAKLARSGSASFYFADLKTNQYFIGQTFTVELRAKTGREAINATGATIKFPPQYLEVVKMSTDQSYCTFYTDNSFDNTTGEIDISCGTPNPGFLGDTPIVTTTFRAKNSGIIDLEVLKNASILANDGKGTNISRSFPKLNLVINQL